MKSSAKKIFIFSAVVLAVASFSAIMSSVQAAPAAIPQEPTAPSTPSSPSSPSTPSSPSGPSSPGQPSFGIVSVSIDLGSSPNLNVGNVEGIGGDGSPIINCGGGSTKCSGRVAQSAKKITFTATPSTGYVFSRWDPASDNCLGTNKTCIVAWGNGSVPKINEIADFAVAKRTITASAGSGGSISPSGSASVDYGSSQSFSITPLANYKISDVLVDGSSVGAVSSYTFKNVTADHSIAAAFSYQPVYKFTFKVTNQTGQNIQFFIPTAKIYPYCQPGSCSASSSVVGGTDIIIGTYPNTGLLSGFATQWQGCTPAANGDSCSFTIQVPTTVYLTVSPKPSFGGPLTADLVYASTTANQSQGTVYLKWPAVKNGSGTYAVYRDGVRLATGLTATSYYDTHAPIGSSHASTVYRVQAVSGNTNLGTITASPIDLDLTKALSGYAWTNIDGTMVSGSFQGIGSPSSFYGNPPEPFTVSGNATVDSVAMSMSYPLGAWKSVVYRCSSYAPAYGCSGRTQIASFNYINGGQVQSFTDKNLTSLRTYYYEVDGYSISSPAWGMAKYFEAKTGGATYQGIGWVNFSSDTSPQYGVYVDSNNNLSGYAWAGSDYGWLSFNDSDAAHPQAKLNGNKLSGWARFLTFANGNSSWDGWVDLSNVTYAPSTGNFGGKTPATPVDILGQMSWCGSSYCVTAGAITSNTPPAVTSITQRTSNGFTVNWVNPQSYKAVQIWVSYPGNTSSYTKLPYHTFYATNANDRIYTETSTQLSYPVAGLNASSTYGVFVRGCLTTSCQ